MGLGQLQPPKGQKRAKKTAAFPTAVKYTNKESHVGKVARSSNLLRYWDPPKK